MPSAKPKPVGARPSHRRKVRIVGQRRPSRAAAISLLAAAGVALLVPVLWRLGRSEEVARPQQRRLAETELQWRCEVGHTFHAAGHAFNADGITKPKACWTCERPAFPAHSLYCPVHDAYDVSVMLERDASGRVLPARWRLPGKPWVDFASDLHCRLCDRVLQYRKDPLRTDRSGQKKRRG